MKKYLINGAAALLVFCSFSTAQVGSKIDEMHYLIVPLMKNGKLTVRGLSNYEVISGNPETPGAPYVIRIHNYDNQIVPPPWHPEDEHIVVVKGTWYVGEGDTWERDGLRELTVGDYVFVPKRMNH